MKRGFRFATTAVLFIVTLFSFAAAQSALSWRVFTRNENTWIHHPNGLLLFSTLSRSIKPFPVDPVRYIDTLTDCIEYDGYLWVASNAGLYQIDMATRSVERIARSGDSTATGKLAQDMDYLWFATDDALFQFDKLGREWLWFALPAPVSRVAGVWSNGEEIFLLGSTELFRFSVATEKWNRYPLDRPLSDGVVFYPGAASFKVLDGTTLALYRPGSFSWQYTDCAIAPKLVADEDSVVYISDGKNVQRVTCESGMVKQLNIPNPGRITAIATMPDSLVFTTEKRIGRFSLQQETMEFIEYDQDVKTDAILKVIPTNAFLLVITDGAVSWYDKETRSWQHVSRTGFRQKRKVFSWTEDECGMRYSRGMQSTVSGNLRTGMTFDWTGYDYDTSFSYRRESRMTDSGMQSVRVVDTTIDSVPLMEYAGPDVIGNVNVHTSDGNDRIADVFFNNSSRVTAPEKGIYYRGNRDDYLNSFRIGTTGSEFIESPLLPAVSMEGGTAALESRARLATRDRKIVRVTGGSGYIMTKTITRVLPYRADGTYDLVVKPAADSTGDDDTTGTADSTIIVKGSCRVIVDGEVLDTTLYNFYTSTGKLRFRALAPIDPVSSIVVEYKVRTVPEGRISNIEMLPSHRFGKLHFGNVTVAPNEWISAQAGFTGIDRDSLDQVFNVAVPLELRNTEKDLMLKLRPEFLYNTKNGTRAGGVQLQSCLGNKTGILFNSLFADTAFTSTDTLTRGYGARLSEYDMTLSHDIRQELPLAYYQHQRYAVDGKENRFALSAGARFTNLPFFEVSVSRNTFERTAAREDTAQAIDSLYTRKDKVKFRLYETSSKLLENLTRFHKVSYDITHSEYRSELPGSGSWVPGRLSSVNFSFAPVQRATLSGELLYRGKMHLDGLPSSDIRPAMTLQMIDVPDGVDVSMISSLKYSRFASENYSTDSLDRSLRVVLKPGKWFSFLGWFSPRAKITQVTRCRFSSLDVPAGHLLLGNEGRTASVLAREAGVNLYPLDGVLFTNNNEWAENDGKTSFRTNNRLQYVFNARNTLTAYWNYADLSTISTHDGLVSFDKIWVPWFRTMSGIKTDIRNDSTGNAINTGPRLTLNINIDKFRFIQSLSNYHDFQCTWTRRNSRTDPVPEITYNFGLRMKVFPNIEFQVKNTSFKFRDGAFDDFTNEVLVSVYF